MSEATMTPGAETTVAESAAVEAVITVGTAEGCHEFLVGAHGRPEPTVSTEQFSGGIEVTAVHATAGGLWVLEGRRNLHHHADGRSVLVAELDGPDGVCVVEHDGAVFVGGARASLWRLTGEVLETVDAFGDAPTSDRWHTPWGGPPDVFSMASHGPDLYVGVHVGGILRSADGGRSWAPTIDLDEDVHQVVADESGELWAATGPSGLAHSVDRGATWSFHAEGLHADYALAVAAMGDVVLLGASSGPRGRDGALYRFDGERFERCTGLPDAFDGAVSPRHLAGSGEVAAVALPSGDVYVSTDAGRVWTRIAEVLPGVSEITVRPVV
jgi:photosystem II stability/assembly factor-like uncharacterized protein